MGDAEALRDTRQNVRAKEQEGHRHLIGKLDALCGSWTIFTRYSPRQATMGQAKAFLNQVKELRPWLT